MAGIGFELRRILQKETFGALARAHFLGALIVLGPFLCSVFCLAGLSVFSIGVTSLHNRQVFTGAVVYIFGGSLVTTGLVQVVVTRYLADLVYKGEYDSLIRSLFPVLLVVCALLGVGGLPFIVTVPLPALTKVTLYTLYLTIGCLWLAVVFVSSAHGHRQVVLIFMFGSVVAFGAGLLLLGRLGLDGLFLGYTAGHILMLALFIRHLVSQFGFPNRWDWGVLGYFKLFPALIFIGLLQSLGIWVDKFIFWTGELSVTAAGIATAPKYDSAMFLAFLTALPAVTHFFVKQEADFSERFQHYFDEVFFRSSFDKIKESADSLRRIVVDALKDIVAIQGVVTFLCAFFGEEILRFLGLPVSQVGMFRCGVVGSLFLVLFMFSNVILLYFDRQREVLFTVAVFFIANLALSLLSLELGYQFYGFGFAAACLAGLLVSLLVLANQLYNLEYMTFATIRVSGQRRARAGLRARRGGMYGRYHDVGAEAGSKEGVVS